MVWNDMQWYSYSLPFLLMQWYARICFAFTYMAIPADAMICKDMFCIHIHCHSCWCKPFEWIRIEWLRIGGISIDWIRMETIRIDRIRAYLLNGYALNGYVLVGYVLNGYVLVGYVLVGYVLNGYVWDMCGVRYANNLLKNPATKRLSGKKLGQVRNPTKPTWNVQNPMFLCEIDHIQLVFLSDFWLPSSAISPFWFPEKTWGGVFTFTFISFSGDDFLPKNTRWWPERCKYQYFRAQCACPESQLEVSWDQLGNRWDQLLQGLVEFEGWESMSNPPLAATVVPPIRALLKGGSTNITMIPAHKSMQILGGPRIMEDLVFQTCNILGDHVEAHPNDTPRVYVSSFSLW